LRRGPDWPEENARLLRSHRFRRGNPAVRLDGLVGSGARGHRREHDRRGRRSGTVPLARTGDPPADRPRRSQDARVQSVQLGRIRRFFSGGAFGGTAEIRGLPAAVPGLHDLRTDRSRALLFPLRSGRTEVQAGATAGALPPRSSHRRQVSALFAVDAFGGGFIGQSILSYYFFLRFGLDLATLGAIFFATQLVTALSFLVSERIARRIGVLGTMVFTHMPWNVFLIGVAFASTPLPAVFFLLCRQSFSQMDVPARQSYVMAIVDES